MDLPFSEHSLPYSGFPLSTGFMHGISAPLLDSRASWQGLTRQPQSLLQPHVEQTAACRAQRVSEGDQKEEER